MLTVDSEWGGFDDCKWEGRGQQHNRSQGDKCNSTWKVWAFGSFSGESALCFSFSGFQQSFPAREDNSLNAVLKQSGVWPAAKLARGDSTHCRNQMPAETISNGNPVMKVIAEVDLSPCTFSPWKWILGLFYVICSHQILGTILMGLGGIKMLVARLSTPGIYLVS